MPVTTCFADLSGQLEAQRPARLQQCPVREVRSALCPWMRCNQDPADDSPDRQLTKSLLKRDFGLQIELPDDRLCPPVSGFLRLEGRRY